MKSFTMAWPAAIDTTDPVTQVLTNLYDITAMGGIVSYSDLEFDQVNFLVGGSYLFTRNFYMTAEAEYAEFTDSANDDGFVYGDQSGDYYRGNIGIGYNF